MPPSPAAPGALDPLRGASLPASPSPQTPTIGSQLSPVESWPYLREDSSGLATPEGPAQPLDSSSRSRRAGFCRGFFGLNVVQRCLSALVLAPVVTYFLWVSPAFATTTFCSFVTSTCSYEYACLANRIRLRLLTRLEAAESELMEDDGGRCGSETSHHSAGSFESPPTANISRDTANLRSRASLGTTPAPDLDLHPTADTDDRDTRAILEEQYMARIDSDLREQEELLQRCAVSGIADRWLGGRTWVAAGLISLLMCAVTSTVFLFLADAIPQLSVTEFYQYRWFYTIATAYVSSLCACLTPDWAYAVILYVQNVIFMVLTMHSTICPINQFGCGQSIVPAQIFMSGIVALLLFRFASARNKVAALMNFMLDALGFLYIIGSLSVLVAFVDDDKRPLYRKLLIALLYVVWASDTGAYVTGKLLAFFKYPNYNPLAAHLSKNKDYEGTLGAILFGMAAMVIASDVLDVPGSTGTKFAFTVLAVIVGRLGDLFESLIKRAAGVKDSGTLIPGHGGVLDRIDALMFATLIFSRYYALVM